MISLESGGPGGAKNAPRERKLCRRCLKPHLTCYCARLRPFRARPEIVLLQHPLERKKTVGTARMAHLCIENSRLISGIGFEGNEQVNALIADPTRHCVVLYPGEASVNISALAPPAIESLFPANRTLVIFVIDGTWLHADKMLKRSPNLMALPQICFTPDRKSEYGFRRQPEDFCWSTIEAVHHMIGILDPAVDAGILLEIFRSMVAHQKSFAVEGKIRRVET